MTHFLRAQPGDTSTPGTWRQLDDQGKRSASINCPQCGRGGTLTDHEIAPDGTITPSVVCPHPGCSYHDMGKLDGWQE